METLPDEGQFLPGAFPLGSWNGFEPVDKAVLMFVQDANSLLLIHKRRGLGAGKVNAPGGRLEAGESYAEAAVRECQEEVLVTPLHPKKVGELYFRFVDGHSIYGEVFWSTSHLGTATATAEADPFWCPISAVPYERMWADDRVWLPQVISGHKFRGFFDFKDDTMLAGSIDFHQ